jgi:hypothetical protein
MEENIVEPKQKSRKKLVTVIIFIIILIAIGYLVGTEINRWWKVRKEYIRMGFASDKFPFRMYTEEELVKKSLWSGESPALNAVPTRTTPEETYAIFRKALVDGDLDKAAECFTEKNRKDWKKSLYEMRDKGFLQEMINDLPEKIENVRRDNSSGSYDYVTEKDGKRYSHVISFIKDWDGDWLIENL